VLMYLALIDNSPFVFQLEWCQTVHRHIDIILLYRYHDTTTAAQQHTMEDNLEQTVAGLFSTVDALQQQAQVSRQAQAQDRSAARIEGGRGSRRCITAAYTDTTVCIGHKSPSCMCECVACVRVRVCVFADVRLELTALCATLEAELSVARVAQPREVEKEVARRMKVRLKLPPCRVMSAHEIP